MRACLMLLLAVSSAWGTVWHVPGDCPTIQQGLDSLSQGDTLLVSTGIYHEALQAPGLSFTWLSVVDSGGIPDRPVVDPSPLEHSDSLSCLILPSGSQAVIENVIFRNGPEMFPHAPGGGSAGGVLDLAHDLTLRRCLFDSTNYGLIVPIGTSGSLEVSECRFANNVLGCLLSRGSGQTWVHNSEFSGGGNMLVWVTDSAVVEGCWFHGTDTGADHLWATGSGITVRNCVFDSTSSRNYDVVYTAVSNGCLWEGNLFHDLYLRGEVMTMYGWPGETSVFRNNVFRNCIGVGNPNANGGLNLQGQAGGMSVVVTGCLFDSCTAWTEYGIGALFISEGEGVVEHSRFVRHEAFAPTVRLLASPGVAISDCHFDRTGLALQADYAGPDTVNAELNWWGDSTGPYHAQLNPGGRGDTIIGPVDFVPWLRDTALAAPATHAVLPATAQLEASPNPFNATTLLHLTVLEPGVYSVDLYNTLGQRVRRIWSGSIAGEKQIVLNGEGLPSGVYFARATLNGLMTAQVKVVLLK